MNYIFNWNIGDVDNKTKETITEKTVTKLKELKQNETDNFEININNSPEDYSAQIIITKNDTFILEGCLYLVGSLTSVLWSKGPPPQSQQ